MSLAAMSYMQYFSPPLSAFVFAVTLGDALGIL